VAALVSPDLAIGAGTLAP